VFYYFSQGRLQGLLALHVDDFVIGGSEIFEDEFVSKFKTLYPFKTWKVSEGEFLGKYLKQEKNFDIVISQQNYAANMKVLTIGKERRKQKDQPCTEEEKSALRGVTGAGNWLTVSTRPDVASYNALLQQKIENATVSELIEANKFVALCRDHSATTITIKSIRLEDAAMLVSTDASWGNAEDLCSQGAYMIFFTRKSIADGHWADVSPLRWRSHKLERQTQSTLGAELMSLSKGIAEANWMRSLFAEALNPNYVLQHDKIFRNQLQIIVTIDNKPVYDHVHADGTVVKDKRIAIDMLLVKKDVLQDNILLRWVDTKQMLSDVLTKPNASADFLRHVLKTGRYIIVEEATALAERVKSRQKQQKQKAATAGTTDNSAT
jgi:hypothetical protein